MMYGTLTDDVTTLSPINNWTMTSVIRVQTGDSTHDISTKGCDDRQSGKSRQLLWMESLSTKKWILSLPFSASHEKDNCEQLEGWCESTVRSFRAASRVRKEEIPLAAAQVLDRIPFGAAALPLLWLCMSVAKAAAAAAVLKPLSQTIFSRTTTETQPAHSKAINGGKMAFKLLCCRLPVFTFNLSFHFVVF